MNAHHAALAWAKTGVASALMLAASTVLWAQRDKPCTTQCTGKGMWGNQIPPESNKENRVIPEVLKVLPKIANASGIDFTKIDPHIFSDDEFEGAYARYLPPSVAGGADGKLQLWYGWGVNRALMKGDPEKWEGWTVLAHEVAHLALGHVFTGGASVAQEAQADRMAGCVIGWLGGSLENAQSVYQCKDVYGKLRCNVPVEAVDNHPGRDERVRIVAEGWTLGSAKVKGTVAQKQMGSPSQQWCLDAVKKTYPTP